jgi:site-specific DNA recombinase
MVATSLLRKRTSLMSARTGTLRALIYTRMSMDRLGEGAGLGRQEEASRALCLARGWQVVHVLDDTISATKHRLADRNGWQQVVRMIKAGEIEVVVAWHLDRVTRDMRDLEDLIELSLEYGVGLATATGDIDLTTDAGRMVARILAAVAAAEGERKAARQILANEQRAREGKPMWVRRPFGFRRDGTLEPAEAELVKLAYEGVLRGTGLNTIARAWTNAGYKTTAPIPGIWTNIALRVLLLSPRNCGILDRYREEIGPGGWTPIVDEPTYRAVVRILKDPGRFKGQGPLRHLMTGIAVCDVCKGGIRAQNRPNRVRKEDTERFGQEFEAVYQCQKGHVSLPVDWVDAQVLRRMVDDAVKNGKANFGEPKPRADTEALKNREEEIHGILAEMGEDRAAGLITRESMIAGTQKLKAEMDEIKAKLALAGGGGAWEYVDTEQLYEEFDGFELGQQRKLVREAFAYIGICQRGRGHRRDKPISSELLVTSMRRADSGQPAS